MDIKLKDFQGPLDLLLHLVSKYEVDIYQVPIVEVIEQYLAYLATLQAMRLEVAGEYMVMASQLMLIKSRKLLPKVVETIEEDDPEQDLLSQLEEYRTFKQLGEELALQHDKRALHFSKPKLELVYDDICLNQDKTTIDLFLAFSKVMAQKQEEMKYNHTTIERDDFRIEDMMQTVYDQVAQENQIKLSLLFKQARSVNELITIFLATLELIKVHKVLVRQETNFSEITLSKENL